jgi:hypothetical protein
VTGTRWVQDCKIAASAAAVSSKCGHAKRPSWVLYVQQQQQQAILASVAYRAYANRERPRHLTQHSAAAHTAGAAGAA